MSQTSANVIAGYDAKASDFNKVVADLAEIYAGGPGVPVGGVISWWSDNTVPLNYKVCDGTAVADALSPLNGLTVPNMTDRFIRGVANANIRTTPASGGVDEVTLTIAQTPSHNHPGSFTSSDGNHVHGYTSATAQIIQRIVNNADGPHGFSDGGFGAATGAAGQHSHGVNVAAQGGSQPHTNIPAYRGMVFVMRIK